MSLIKVLTLSPLQNMFRAVLLSVFLHSVKSQDLTTVQFCGNTPADVGFLLDSSNSMWGPDFKKQLDFVSNVTRMFQIGENATQVGLMTFNDNVQLQFSLNEYRDKETLIRAIKQVEQTLGYSTETDKALHYMRTRFFSKRHGAREGVPHIAVVITDGQSEKTLKTLIEATKAKRQNIIIFTIGIGKLINIRELEKMASSPAIEHAFAVDSFSFLNSIKEKLAVKTCMVTTPPTLIETQTSTQRDVITHQSTSSLNSETATLTTTLSLPTTTSWVDVVSSICEKKAVDIVFAMDSSEGVSHNDFWYQIKLIRDMTMGLDIGSNKTRIGIVIYGEKVVPVFDLSDRSGVTSAISQVYTTKRIKGSAQLDRVINFVRTISFRKSIVRSETAQLLVLITSGRSDNLHNVKKEAGKARNNGIDILVIGVGDKVNTEELDIIAGVSGNSQQELEDEFTQFLQSTFPRRQKLYTLNVFNELDTVAKEVAIEACTTVAPLIQLSDQACGHRKKADMMFVMDSASAGKRNTKKSLDFMKHVAGTMEVSEHAVQIGVLQPEECIPKSESFSLNSHNQKDQIISAFERPQGDDKLLTLLKNMRKEAFKKKKGGRTDAKKIAVVLVDGDLQHPLKVLKEARRAKVHGIEVYVIFVGPDKPQQEVRDMCAYPPDKHFFQVPDYDRLKDIEDNLIDILCDEL